MRKKLLSVLGALLAAALIVCAPGRAALAAGQDDADAAKVATLSGKVAGVMTGTPQDGIVRAAVPDAELLYFNSMSDLVLALQSGKIDFLCVSSVNYYSLAEQYDDLAYLDVALATFDVGAIFPQTAEADSLRAQFNEYVGSITASGELARLQDYWLMPHDWENVDIPETGENGVLHMATSNTMKPFSMELNGKDAGFDIAVVAGFCREYGYGLQIDDVDFAGVLSGIASGMYDLAAGQISWTQERAQSVRFSDFYYTQRLVPIVRASDYAEGEVVRAAGAGSGNESGASGQETGDNGNPVWTSIRRTLVDQDRWKSVLAGLGTTFLITIAGFAVANVLGALLCAMALSGKKALKVVSRVYAGLMQGIPVVVVLMLLYYVVLAGAKLSNVLVASIGFGLVFAAYLAQLFEGGILGVDAGQWEAALASGLTKRQAFLGIVLPQAARTSLTGYFTNLISLMKGTAVVGYIAVADLTKAGDVIRSATYEAFVPILTVAALYLLMTGLLIGCMELVRRALQKPRPRKAGGHA